ncbi:hypothetical protein C8R47DRAFT_1068562 [Mycena vitilis]|nr:hypothetical protein C8R47DRAFT_1068562 [Mycena vitilis]
MDVCALGRFHRSVTRLPLDSYALPPGGLRHFLREDLRSKIFLISLGVFEDRWATRTVASLTPDAAFNLRVCLRIVVEHMYYAARLRQNELRGCYSRFNMPTEASWMFYLLGALLLAVGFEGDNGVKERGIGPLEMAFSEAVFLLRCSSETFLLHTAMNTPRPFDYEEYDPHRTLDDFFPHRRSPSTFARIPLQDPSPVTFNIQERPEFWSDAGRIVESTLLALSRVSTDIEVEISTTGEALSVSKKSVEAIVSAMVHPSPRSADLAEKSKGIRSYVAPGVGTGSAAVQVVLPSAFLSAMIYKPLALTRTSYGVVEIYVIVNEYCHQAIRYHSNKTSSIMERVIRPSVYLLKQKLRGDASDWVSAKDLHPDELYLVRNSVRSMIDVLRLLMDSGAASPTPEQVLEGAEGECRSGAIRATSLLCLLDFYVMLLVYCTDPETELPFPAHESLVMEAVRIARSWDILDPAVDFKGYGPLYLHNSPPRAPSPELSDDEELSVSCQASRACMHIARLEISEETFMQREHWVPPMPIQEIIPRVLRPAVYLLHQALDPYYIGRICGPYHLSRTTYGMVRRALRKMLELVCLISLQRPEYPSYVQIWDGVMDHSVIPPEPIVSDRSKRVFEILSDLVDNYGFKGSERCEALELEHSLRGAWPSQSPAPSAPIRSKHCHASLSAILVDNPRSVLDSIHSRNPFRARYLCPPGFFDPGVSIADPSWLAGFHGDDHADFRNTVLSTVAHFQYCMVVRPGYLSHPVDAPGFSFDVLDPFEYGVGTHTKATQIAEVNSHGGLAHAFGQNLPRYCPESASEGLVYRFPLCPEEFRFAPTRPNTPIPELVPIVE